MSVSDDSRQQIADRPTMQQQHHRHDRMFREEVAWADSANATVASASRRAPSLAYSDHHYLSVGQQSAAKQSSKRASSRTSVEHSSINVRRAKAAGAHK